MRKYVNESSFFIKARSRSPDVGNLLFCGMEDACWAELRRGPISYEADKLQMTRAPTIADGRVLGVAAPCCMCLFRFAQLAFGGHLTDIAAHFINVMEDKLKNKSL